MANNQPVSIKAQLGNKQFELYNPAVELNDSISTEDKQYMKYEHQLTNQITENLLNLMNLRMKKERIKPTVLRKQETQKQPTSNDHLGF